MAQTKKQSLEIVKAALAERIPEIKAVAPRGTVPERFVRMAYVAIANDPLLAQCTPGSLVMRTMEAAQVGLELDPTLREAALVARRNRETGQYEATLMPMYQGLIKLALQHESVVMIEAEAVHAKDLFSLKRGTEGRGIVHEPCIDADPGVVVGYYALVWKAAGPPEIEFMTARQVEGIRAGIKGSEKPSSPWVNYPEEMGKKTVVKRALKMAPKTPNAAAMISADDDLIASATEITLTPASKSDPAPAGNGKVAAIPAQASKAEPEPAEEEEEAKEAPEVDGPPEEPADEPEALVLEPDEVLDPEDDAGDDFEEEDDPELTQVEKKAVREKLKAGGVSASSKAKAYLTETLGRPVTALSTLRKSDLAKLGVES